MTFLKSNHTQIRHNSLGMRMKLGVRHCLAPRPCFPPVLSSGAACPRPTGSAPGTCEPPWGLELSLKLSLAHFISAKPRELCSLLTDLQILVGGLPMSYIAGLFLSTGCNGLHLCLCPAGPPWGCCWLAWGLLRTGLCPPPTQILHRSANCSVMVFGGWGLWEVIRVR